jgi:hypothetical protein
VRPPVLVALASTSLLLLLLLSDGLVGLHHNLARLRFGLLGRKMRSTPSRLCALTFPASTVEGSVKLRLKLP